MRLRPRVLLLPLISVVLLLSCRSTPEQSAAEHAGRGDAYVRQGKYREAVIEFRNAVKSLPNDGGLHWKLAQAALEAKDIRTAYEELQKAVALAPGNLDALGRLGELHLLAGKAEEAGKIADNLVKTRPQDPKGFLLQGGLSMRAGRFDEAIGRFKTAVSLDPKASRPMLVLGNLYLLKGDRSGAKEWLDKALAVDPGASDVRLARGNFFFAAGDRDAGEMEYRKAIEIGKDKEALRIALAEQYLLQRRNDDAAKELQAVIKEMNSQRARKVLAEVRIETGDIGSAKPIVDAIVKQDEKDLDGKYLRGRIALAERRVDDARKLFAEVVAQDGDMARARLFYGLTGVLQGQIEDGKREIEEAVRLDPGYARARLVLGELYLESNLPAAAEKEALEVLRRNPANGLAAVLYADSLLFRKDWAKAEQVYGAIVKQMPQSPIGYFKMGISRKLQNRPGEAAAYFAQAVERNPKELTSVAEYVFALTAAGQADKAGKVVDRYLAENPKDASLWDMAGRFHLAMRAPDRAEAAFLKAIDLSPDFVQPYYDLGVLYATQKRLREAEDRLRKVVERNDRNAGAHALLGVVLNTQGKIDDANRQYRRVLDLDPRNALAANNLAGNLSEHGGNLDEALKFAQVAREAVPEDPAVGDTLGWIYFRKGLIDMAYPLIAEASRKLRTNAAVRYHHGMVLAKKGKRREAAAELSAALAIDHAFTGADEARNTLKSLK